ncbi:MAG: hypothetical protein K1X86_00105 [Ignavibacteria bacterium]|nr:hypothetical protein [Ignavibacteria bacterium]
MYTHLLSLEQSRILKVALDKQQSKKKKAFYKRRLNHFNKEKLKKVSEQIEVHFSDKLYEIPFKCYFSFYLYLILKKNVQFLDWLDMPYYFRIAVSQDLNINKLSKQTGVCRNVIRKAFMELIRFKLVELSDYVEPNHKSCKACIVYNDFYIHCFDSELGHVLYSTEIPYNFYNKGK